MGVLHQADLSSLGYWVTFDATSVVGAIGVSTNVGQLLRPLLCRSQEAAVVTGRVITAQSSIGVARLEGIHGPERVIHLAA